ncbi:MAG: type II toxin-antitoxin system RelE/ParE family toxin [Chloroflexi bacterium]|nr:type II toxin-antitoxin system RelE/ParE family toxin [Chloroflexota bacterium]
MPYSVEFEERANRDLTRLDAQVSRRIRNRLDDLASQAETVSHRALTGPLRGLFRLRAGDYRIIYELDRGRRLIMVLRVEHRSEAYRR